MENYCVMPRVKIDLTEFLLTDIRRRPGMFLNEPKLSNLVLFLTGYYFAADDPYFDETEGFLTWFYREKEIEPGPYWHTEFLAEANGNQQEALDIYFKHLEQYQLQKQTGN